MINKKISFSNIIIGILSIVFVHNIQISTPQTKSNIHVLNGIRDMGDGPRKYKFRDVSTSNGLLSSFPWLSIRAILSDEIMNSVGIEYWIYTSIEEAELGMVERLDMSNLLMRNMIDFPLPEGEIGDNCWYQLESGIIQFIRNNVLVLIGPLNFGDSFNQSNIELVSRKIDEVILGAVKVTNVEQLPTPIINPVIVISDLPNEWGQSIRVKVDAINLKSQNLFFREIGAGLALINDNGIFTITPDKSIPIFVCENPNKFNIKIWVWNDEHLVTLIEKEFFFNK